MGLLNVAYLLAYFWVRPADLGHPEVLPTLIVLISATVLYTAPGHLAYCLLRRSWIQRRAQEAQARELEQANELNEHLLLTALPPTTSRRLGAAGGSLGLRLREVSVLVWEPLGLGIGPLSGAWLQTVHEWVAREAEARGLAYLPAFGRDTCVVSGLDGRGAAPDALQALGAALIAYAKGVGSPCALGVYLDQGQVLVGRHEGRPWLYDPWGTLLTKVPPWHRLSAEGGVVTSSSMVG